MSGVKHLQFVDTNVLIYAHDRSAGDKHNLAKDLIHRLWSSREGCLSIQVLQEFYVTLTRKVAKPLTSEVAAQLIHDLSVWQVHSPQAHDVLDAIQIQRLYTISFWDAMIITSAIRLNCQTLWSEDLNSGQMFDPVRVINPFAQA